MTLMGILMSMHGYSKMSMVYIILSLTLAIEFLIYIAAWCLVFNSVLKLIITILKCSVYGGSQNPKGHLHGSYDPGFGC